MRCTAATICVEVRPFGLSTITQPCTGWPRLRLAIVVVGRCGEIALHAVGFENRLDLLGFRKGLVLHEAQIRREFERDGVTELAAQKRLVLVQRRDHLPGIASSE